MSLFDKIINKTKEVVKPVPSVEAPISSTTAKNEN